MAAISHVFTIRRAAQILGRDEDLLWELSDQLEPEQFAEKLEIGRAMRNIRIQSLMVANLSCVAQTGLESMLPIGTPRKPFSANCYAWLVILGNKGPFAATYALAGWGKPPQLLFTSFSSTLGMTHVLLPYMVLALYGVMRKIDPSYMRAAEGLGARPFGAF